MAVLGDPLLIEVLKACEPSAPLYPALFAATSGLDRGLLDEALDQLRLRGLVRFSDWVQGKGQGYVMTPQGMRVVQNPRLLGGARPEAPEPDSEVEELGRPWARGEAVRDALLHPIRPVVCMSLLVLNILVFALGLLLAGRQGVAGDYLGGGPSANIVYDELGALIPPRVLVLDEWWRLLAYAFVHGGLIHIALNMYFLFSLGPLLETMWGSLRFLVVYLVSALVGGCAVMLTMRTTVGASGALCGLLTSMGMWVYLNRRFLPQNVVSTWMRAIITNVMLIGVMSIAVRNVSWECHLGGAIGGALVSVGLNYHRFGRGWQRFLGGLGAVLVPASAIELVLQERADLVRELGAPVAMKHLQLDPRVQKKILGMAEMMRVTSELLPLYKTAEHRALAAYVDQAAPLFRDLQEETDRQRLGEAKEKFEDVERRLRDTIGVLEKTGAFSDEQIRHQVRQAIEYLQAWSDFYAAFAKVLASPPPVPVDQVEGLARHLDEIAKARSPLEHSPFFPTDPDGPKLRKERGGA